MRLLFDRLRYRHFIRYVHRLGDAENFTFLLEKEGIDYHYFQEGKIFVFMAKAPVPEDKLAVLRALTSEAIGDVMVKIRGF